MMTTRCFQPLGEIERDQERLQSKFCTKPQGDLCFMRPLRRIMLGTRTQTNWFDWWERGEGRSFRQINLLNCWHLCAAIELYWTKVNASNVRWTSSLEQAAGGEYHLYLHCHQQGRTVQWIDTPIIKLCQFCFPYMPTFVVLGQLLSNFLYILWCPANLFYANSCLWGAAQRSGRWHRDTRQFFGWNVYRWCTFFPKQLWSWMGFSILPRNRFCSIIISWFRLGFRGLSPYCFGILFHHLFLVPARVPCLPTLLASWSIIISWFRLGFRGSSPYSSGILFKVPGIVSLVFWHPVPSSFPGSGLGSGARLPTLQAFCSRFRGLSP